MNTINSIIIEGHLVRDAILKTTPNGTPVCNFSLATNRYYTRDDEKFKETSFIDIETWAELAKQCSEDGVKGRGARVVGRLKQDRWKGGDGKSYSRIKIVADDVAFKSLPDYKKSSAKKAESPTEVAVEEAIAF